MLSFESHGGRLTSFNDGHIPETFRFQSTDNNDESSNSKIVTYDHSALPSRSEVHIYDGVLHPHHARMLYDATSESVGVGERCEAECVPAVSHQEHNRVSLKGESPWGTYVTIEEALNWIEWKQTNDYVDVSEDLDECCCISSSYEVYKSKWMCNIINFCKWQQMKQTAAVDPNEQNQSIDIKKSNSADVKVDTPLDIDSMRHALAREAVAQFFLQTIPVYPGSQSITLAPDPPPRHESLYQLNHFLDQAHGVAVWALSSHLGQSVQYHTDYAELLRYEYNVTVPPLFAGTIQCSELWNDGLGVVTADVGEDCDGIHECCGHCRRRRPRYDANTMGSGNIHTHRPLRCSFDGIHECGGICTSPQLATKSSTTDQRNIMRGGEFCANLRGLEHYTEHGYKGNLSGDAFGGWKRPIYQHDSQLNNIYRDESTQWVTIPYAFNRGICHKGDLPHLSAPIEQILVNKANASNPQSLDNSFPSRVIVGFNVFGHDVGDVIAKAPEHSRAFRRKVKLYRATVGACATDTSNNVNTKALDDKKKSGLNLEQVSQNKALAKLLVLAKREKVKQEFKQQQDKLTNSIWRKLLESKIQNEHSPLSVGDVVKEFGNATIDAEGRIPWPKPDDVHVHLHRMIKEKKPVCDVDGIAGPPGVCYVIFVMHNKEHETGTGINGWTSLSTLLDIEMEK